jgi:hypothetical protein
MATPSLILVPSKYKVGTLYTEVATTSAGTVLGSLGDFNVTRASVATRVNNQGFIETIPAVTNLIVQSQNWLASGWRSDATGLTITITGTTGTVDPLGTNTANAISPTNVNVTHLKVGSENSASFTSGTVYTSSAFFKQGTGNAGRYVQLTYPATRFTQEGYANFDLQLGTVAVVSGDVAADTNRAASIENYGNGWYRCRFTATCSASGTGNGFTAVLITASGSTRALPFAGTITDILYGWGAQTEASSSASPYVATTTAAVTNSIPRIDYYTSSGTVGCPALLVEPSGTNLAWHSHLWVSANNWVNTAVTVVTGTSGTIDPFGTNLANAISPTSGSSAHIAQSNSPTTIGYTSGTIYTQSAFFKQGAGVAGRYVQMTFPGVGNSFTQLGYANFDLQLGTVTVVTGTTADTNRAARIENYGNGWYRCQLTATANVTSTGPGVAALLITSSGSTRVSSFAGTTTDILYGFGAQLEAGSVATSYIPTTTGTVTRNADVINLSGAVSGCIGQTEGTIYAEVVLSRVNTSPLITISDGSDSNRIQIAFASATSLIAIIRIAGATANYTVTIPTIPATGGVYKMALGYKTDDYCFALNGTAYASTASRGVPACNKIGLGTSATDGAFLNDRIRAAALYTTRLTNEELELLTYPTYYSNVRDLIWDTFVARSSTFSELPSCLQTRHNQLISV